MSHKRLNHVTMRVNDREIADLKAEAQRSGLTTSEVVQKAIKRFLRARPGADRPIRPEGCRMD
jgi:catalase (peroxidase I)